MTAKRNIFIILLLCLIATTYSYSGTNNIKVGFDYGYPPYEYRDKDTAVGFLVDLINEIAHEMAFEPKITTGQWADIVVGLNRGEYDIIGMFYSPERAKKYNLTVSFLNVSHSIFYRKGAEPIKTIEDLKGKTVVVEVSDLVQSSFKDLAPDAKLVIVDNPLQALDLITKEGYEYAILPKLMAYHFIKENHYNIISTGIDVCQNKYCFAIPKDNPELLYKINEGLNIIQETGRFSELYDKWFGTLDKPEIKFVDIAKIVAVIVVPLLIISLLIIVWTFSLKKQVKQKTAEIEKELQEKNAAEESLLIARFALDNSVDCIFGIDKLGKFVYVNDAVCNALGYTKREILSMTVIDIDPTFKPEKWLVHWDEIKQNKFKSLKTIQIKKDKSFINVEGNIYYFSSGNSEFMYAITRDVTDKLKFEDEIHKSEALFRNMFEKSSVIMYFADPLTFKIIDANRAAVNFYGYSKEEFTNLKIMDLNHLEFDEVRNLIERENKNELISVDLTHFKKNGEPRQVTVSGSTLQISDKEIVFTIVTDNTDKNKAMLYLQESEEKFQKAFMTSPDAININRVSDGMYYDVNESFLNTLEYKREEVIGKTSLELNIWQNPQDRRRLVKELNEKGECVDLESNFLAKSGNTIFGLISARVIELFGEKCIISITRNITERKKEDIYRQALYKISDAAISTPDFDSLCKRIHNIISDLMPSTNLYIALYDRENDSFEYPYFVDEFDDPPQPRKRAKGLTELIIDSGDSWLVDPNEFYELARKGLVENIGTPSIDWLGAPLKINDDTIGAIVVQSYTEGVRYNNEHKKILSFVSNQIAMALSQKRIQEELKKSNELLEIRVEERTTQLRHANEELLAQVDERMRIESEIRESEERFRLMADSAPVLIWMTDSLGIIRYVNRTWIDFTGISLSDIGTDYWNMIIHNEDIELFNNTFKEATNSHSHFEVKVRVKTTLGDYKYVLFNAVPRFFKGDKFLGFIGSAIDINDLHNALEQEKELNFLKTRFISTVSHEYRTPLTTILTSTYLIDTFIKTGNSSEAGKFLERIQNSVKNMTSLLDQVLTISRSETGKLSLNPVLTNVYDFCLSFIDEFKIIDRNNHSFVLNAGKEISKEVCIDPNLLHQILSNLFTNAIKYSPDNSEIELSVHSEKNNYIFAVRDGGMGIPKEQLPLLFEPFFRASNVGVIQGTGLGLSIVKRCIDLCQGEIFVDSTVGKGTTIEFVVPLFDCEVLSESDDISE